MNKIEKHHFFHTKSCFFDTANTFCGIFVFFLHFYLAVCREICYFALDMRQNSNTYWWWRNLGFKKS